LPNLKISVVEAITGYTSQAAMVSGLAGRCGELAVNAMADLTILNRNITSIPSDDILKEGFALIADRRWCGQFFVYD